MDLHRSRSPLEDDQVELEAEIEVERDAVVDSGGGTVRS